MTISRASACARLSAMGIHQSQVHQIIDQVDSWNKSSGPEWTVSRLKALKTDFLHHLAKDDVRSSWIARKPNGVPKGPLGFLFGMTKTPKGISKALNALMVYSASVSTNVTPSQWRKFASSVENSPPAKEGCLDNGIQSFKSGVVRCTPRPALLDDLVLGERFAPVGRKSIPEKDLLAWFSKSADDGFVRRMSQRYPECFSGIRPDAAGIWSSMPDWDSVPSVGKIGFIQEAGFKLRAVANPNRIIQLALKPLKDILLKVCEQLSSDCTHDQQKGVLAVQGWLKEGKLVHSIDLSDATNNFPLEPQLQLLRRILPESYEPYIKLFHESSRGPWLVRDPLVGWRTIQWSKGQPLGLGPSFPSFALTHHAAMREAAIRCSIDPKGKYYILGDDVVISDPMLAKSYLQVLSDLGCPVSQQKSITSSLVAEFAGKVITPERIHVPYKWRETSDRSFLDLARNLGPQSLNLLRPRQREIVKLICEIPEEYGGLGWNPKGKPYVQRVSENLHLIRLLESESTTPMTRVNSEVTRLRLELRRTTSFTVNPWTWGKVVGESSSERPVLNEQHVRSRLMADIRPLSEVVPEGQQMPEEYRCASQESDPRGISALDSLSAKLKDQLAAKRLASQVKSRTLKPKGYKDPGF